VLEGYVSYHLAFRLLHRKKFTAERSGKQGGQLMSLQW